MSEFNYHIRHQNI